jgi:peptidoglycan hydrolase CwlO-like protein
MKINKTLILVLIVGAIALYSLFEANSIKTDVAGYYRKIDSLQNEIDSVENVNKQIDNHIANVDNDINKVEKDIVNVNKNITIIKNQTNEKVSAVNDYTIHDLIKFFSDRYESNVGEARLDSTSKGTDGKISH